MDQRAVGFGVLLRRWRQRRRMTQIGLASAANTSSRHLSFLETGRAQPSRQMVMQLAGSLELPLRERNGLLLAAGFAPAYEERPLAELTAAREAIERVLNAHKPYPAFAVDRLWNIVLSNRALPALYVDVSPELLQPPVNSIRLTLHPRGMAPRIVNLGQWRRHVIAELSHQLDVRADPGIRALLAEVMQYPAPEGDEPFEPEGPAQRYLTPLKINSDAGIISFLSTITVFATPTDVTLSELALEMLFPADAATVAAVSLLSSNDGVQGASAYLLADADAR